MSEVPIGVVTVSDRAAAGVYEDKGGPGIETALKAILATPWRPVRRLVPDSRETIAAALRELADVELCSLILTTGGTGPSPPPTHSSNPRRVLPPSSRVTAIAPKSCKRTSAQAFSLQPENAILNFRPNDWASGCPSRKYVIAFA